MISIVDRVYRRRHFLTPFIGLFIVMALVLVACGGQASSSDTTSTTPTSTVGSTPTPQVVHYPPTTQADLDTAWAHAAANAQEIEQAIHDNDRENIPE